MNKKQFKLDIFNVLKQISTKNVNFYETLTEEEQKAFQPLVVMRWLTGTNDVRQIYFLNELVNPLTFPLSNHKQLLYYLMTICGSGQNQRYQWKKQKTKKNVKLPNTIGVIKQYFRYNSKEANEALPLLTNENILDYADQLGKQSDEIKLIKKELKTRL